MQIGELSAATGASPRSLRYYESLGLIQSERRPNGYRSYGAGTVATVQTIRSLLDLGFTTSLISNILPCTGDGGPVAGECAGLARRIAALRDDVDDKVRRLTDTRDALAQYLQSMPLDQDMPVERSA